MAQAFHLLKSTTHETYQMAMVMAAKIHLERSVIIIAGSSTSRDIYMKKRAIGSTHLSARRSAETSVSGTGSPGSSNIPIDAP
jgi:hypothetical protein